MNVQIFVRQVTELLNAEDDEEIPPTQRDPNVHAANKTMPCPVVAMDEEDASAEVGA